MDQVENDAPKNSQSHVSPNLDFDNADGAFPAHLRAVVPPDSQQTLLDLLKPGERLLFLEPTLYSRTHGVLLGAAALGTVAFVVLLGLALFSSVVINLNVVILMATFPIALAVQGYNYYHRHKSFTAFTDQRILNFPASCAGSGHQIVAYQDITAVKKEYNWLHWREELHVKSVVRQAQPSKYLDFISEKSNLQGDKLE